MVVWMADTAQGKPKSAFSVVNCYQLSSRFCAYVPAVHHSGTSVGWVDGLDPPDEEEERGGVAGDAKVWPGCEVKLRDNALLTVATLRGREVEGKVSKE